MRREELKTGLFGYQKFSVCRYISALEEQYSAQLLEKERESREALDQARRRIRELEAEVAGLRRQLETRRCVPPQREAPMEDSARETVQETEALSPSASQRNMSLFQRKPEPEARQ